MKSYKIEINAGDSVEVGRFRNVQTKIKSIEVDENGQPVIITSKGRKKLFSCRLVKLLPGSKTPKQILMEKNKNKKKKRAEEPWNGML
jgi:hypothetical protein